MKQWNQLIQPEQEEAIKVNKEVVLKAMGANKLNKEDEDEFVYNFLASGFFEFNKFLQVMLE